MSIYLQETILVTGRKLNILEAKEGLENLRKIYRFI